MDTPSDRERLDPDGAVPSDEELWRRAKDDGDAGSQAELLSRWFPGLVHFVRHVMAGNPTARRIGDAEDVAQSVIAHLLGRDIPDRVISDSAFRAYLHQSLRNKIIDYARKPDARLGELGDGFGVGLPGDGKSPSSIAAELERAESERRALEWLRLEHPAEYELAVAVMLHGKTWAQLGKELGVHKDTLRLRVRRKLRQRPDGDPPKGLA